MATGPDGPEGPETPSGAPTRVRGRKRRFAKRWSRRTSLLVIAAFSALVISFFNIDIGRISIFGGSIKSAAEKYGSKYLERPLHIGKIVAYVSQGRFGFEDVVIEGPTKDAKPFFAASGDGQSILGTTKSKQRGGLSQKTGSSGPDLPEFGSQVAEAFCRAFEVRRR